MDVAEPKTQGEILRMIWREMFGNGHPGLIEEMRCNNEKVSALEKRFDTFEAKLDDRKAKKITAWGPYAASAMTLIGVIIVAIFK